MSRQLPEMKAAAKVVGTILRLKRKITGEPSKRENKTDVLCELFLFRCSEKRNALSLLMPEGGKEKAEEGK